MAGFNFAPRGYAFCNGQLLSIAQNTALFSLLGTTYGGDGRVTFGLPDLRGRVPINQGTGPGLTPRSMGELSGEEIHTLISTEMPQHAHSVTGITIPCSTEDGETGSPNGTFPAVPGGAGGAVNAYATAATAGKSMAPGGTGTAQIAGGSQPHNNMQPYLVVNFAIALEGIFPSRN